MRSFHHGRCINLRRTFVTGMVELRVPPHVVEITVNHIGGTRSGVASRYQSQRAYG